MIINSTLAWIEYRSCVVSVSQTQTYQKMNKGVKIIITIISNSAKISLFWSSASGTAMLVTLAGLTLRICSKRSGSKHGLSDSQTNSSHLSSAMYSVSHISWKERPKTGDCLFSLARISMLCSRTQAKAIQRASWLTKNNGISNWTVSNKSWRNSKIRLKSSLSGSYSSFWRSYYSLKLIGVGDTNTLFCKSIRLALLGKAGRSAISGHGALERDSRRKEM